MNPRLQRKQISGSLCRSLCVRWPRLFFLVPLLLVGSFWAASQLESAPLSPPVVMAWQTDLSVLPISFPIQSPEVAAYFHEIARPQDIASVAPASLFLLSQDAPGQKMVGFRSWAEAQAQLDSLTGAVDMVMYNPEHWELTPENEQNDLVTTVQQFAEFAHERNLRIMFAPDRQYAELYLSQVAPSIDAVLLQGQRLQHDPQTFAAWVLGMAEVAHAANPDIQVFVQVGATRGTASEMLAAIETVASDIDGIAIWSLPRTLDVLQEFVALLQESPPTVDASPSPTTVIAAAVPTPTENATVLPPPVTPTAEPAPPTPTPTLGIGPNPTDQVSAPIEISVTAAVSTTVPPQAETAPSSLGMDWLTDLLLFVGGMGLGAVIGFLLGWMLRRGSRV